MGAELGEIMVNQAQQAALVTGAAKGIGRAIAHRLAEDGFTVWVVDLLEPQARKVVDELREKGFAAHAAVVDITDSKATQELIDSIPDLQVVVNNAGLFRVKPFEDLNQEDFRTMYEVNLVSMFTLCQQALSKLGQGGRIINIASRAALGARGYAHYVASKSAVVGFTRALALEVAERKITVNAVAPGVIQTDMLLERSDLPQLQAQQPTGELGDPEDIAQAVSFFADPRTKFVTGQILLVDGGRTLGGTDAF